MMNIRVVIGKNRPPLSAGVIAGPPESPGVIAGPEAISLPCLCPDVACRVRLQTRSADKLIMPT